MRRLSIAILSIFVLSNVFGLGNKIQAAEKYPSKPITFIVALEAGSDGDIVVRPIVKKVSAILGQPILVVNKPGAGSTIGYREIYAAKPDGYTIGWAALTLFINKLQGLFPIDYHEYTFIYSYSSWYPVVVASTKTKRPFKNMEEVLSFAKSHPGEVSIATSGTGMSWWLFTMAFQEATGLKFNVIPQPGAGGLAIAQAAGGHVDLAILGLPASIPQIEAENVRLLSVLGPKRASGKYNDIPTINDLGYEMNIASIQSIIGPPRLPKHIADRLIEAFQAAITNPEYQTFLAEKSGTPLYFAGDQSIKLYDEQIKIYRRIMDRCGLLREK